MSFVWGLKCPKIDSGWGFPLKELTALRHLQSQIRGKAPGNEKGKWDT